MVLWAVALLPSFLLRSIRGPSLRKTEDEIIVILESKWRRRKWISTPIFLCAYLSPDQKWLSRRLWTSQPACPPAFPPLLKAFPRLQRLSFPVLHPRLLNLQFWGKKMVFLRRHCLGVAGGSGCRLLSKGLFKGIRLSQHFRTSHTMISLISCLYYKTTFPSDAKGKMGIVDGDIPPTFRVIFRRRWGNFGFGASWVVISESAGTVVLSEVVLFSRRRVQVVQAFLESDVRSTYQQIFSEIPSFSARAQKWGGGRA